MATVIGLAMKITADASSVPKALTPVERAFEQLSAQADKATKIFDNFAGSSSAAAQAQTEARVAFAAIAEQLRTGVLTAEQYAAAFAALTESTRATVSLFEEGARVTAQYKTAESERIQTLFDLNQLQEAGAISAATYAAAVAEVSGANAAAQAAEDARIKILSEGASITAQFATEEEKRAAKLADLNRVQEAGVLSAETYARALAEVSGANAAAAAAATAAAESKRVATLEAEKAALEAATEAEDARSKILAEGARITAEFATEEEKRAAKLANLNKLQEEGALSAETYARAIAEASGDNAKAAAEAKATADATATAEAARAKAIASAAAITQAALGPQQLYDQKMQELQQHLAAGRITQDTYNASVAKAAGTLATAEKAAAKAGLKFNELSGIFAVIPGPLGSIAGRLSGFASAAEGLNGLFGAGSGGLLGGLNTLKGSFGFLLTPMGAAVAGVAAFGAAAVAVVSGLSQLASEVENLGFAADKAGVSFESIQILDEAAKRSGVSVEELASGIQKFSIKLSDAAKGSGDTFDALTKLGFSLQDIQSGTNDPAAFAAKVAESIKGIANPAERAAAQMEVLGKSGATLVRGFSAIDDSTLAVGRFNKEISKADSTRLLLLNTGFADVKASLTGFGRELLTPFIGATQSLADGFAATVTAAGRTAGAILDSLSPITSVIGAVINGFLQFGAVVSTILGTVFEPFAALGRAIAQTIDNISVVFTKVGTAITGAILPIREFFKFGALTEGLTAAMASLGETVGVVFAKMAEIFGRVAAIISAVIGKVIDGVSKGVTYVGNLLTAFGEWSGIGSVVASVAGYIGKAFGNLWDSIKAVVAGIGGFIERVLKFAEDWLGIKTGIEAPVVVSVQTDELNALMAESPALKATVDDITKGLDAAINESAKFGTAGFNAALKYQESIKSLKDDLTRGILDEGTFKASAARAGELFKTELKAIEEDNKLELKVDEDATKTIEGIQKAISKAVDESTKFGKAGFDAALEFQTSLERLQAQFKGGVINQEAVDQGVAKANEHYKEQLKTLDDIDKATKKQIEDDTKRIEILSGGGKAVSQAEEDVLTVQRERLRVLAELAAASVEGNSVGVAAAQVELAQLDKLKTKTDAQLAASSQGFSDGYDKAFESIDKSIEKLSQSAVGFGKIGAEATDQLRAGIANAQEQAKAGFLNADQLAAEVAAEEARFNKEIENIKAARDFAKGLLDASLTENEKNQAAAQERSYALEQEFGQRRVIIEEQILAAQQVGDLKTANAAQQRLVQLDAIAQKERDIASGKNQVDQLLFNNLNGQEQARLNFVKQEEAARIQAAKNVVLVEQQIAIVEQEIKKAREEKNLLEAKAGVARLAQLDQVLEKEKGVANGKVQQQKQQAESQNQYMQQQEAAAQQQQQQQAAAAQAAAAAASAEFSRQEERLAKLSSVSTESLSVGDVRSKEGVALVLNLAATAQDPALIEARIQTKLLNAIALGLAGAASNYFNQPVAIVGAARLN